MSEFPQLTDDQTELLHKVCQNNGATTAWLKSQGVYDVMAINELVDLGLILRGFLAVSWYPTDLAMEWYAR